MGNLNEQNFLIQNVDKNLPWKESDVLCVDAPIKLYHNILLGHNIHNSTFWLLSSLK